MSVVESSDTPPPSRTFLKPSMSPVVVGCLSPEGVFILERLMTMWFDYVELFDAELTLTVMLHNMTQFSMLVP